ncbi:hypothetical protein E4T56_gene11139 [Termitomyces sp. T112]|nr:hypothetical protein E4T56_gene11139 [Termitomyces sp. T112]
MGSHFGTQMNPQALLATPSEDVVHYVDGYPITESSKATEAIFGEKVAEPLLVDYEGGKAVMFDLALQREGTFILRYRIFDISSLAVPGMKSTAQTEVYGGPFKVYATKDFPGLAPSTELIAIEIFYTPHSFPSFAPCESKWGYGGAAHRGALGPSTELDGEKGKGRIKHTLT